VAVYTEVPFEAAAALVSRLNIGTLQSLEGCKGGIENTNYFADTSQGRFVLTLFERLGAEQLPFYLRLMQHLAARGIPVPDPQADAQGDILHTLCGKPATVVNRLSGGNRLAPDAHHCAQLGDMLARMHLAGRDFTMHQPNLRGLAWWTETVPVVVPFLSQAQRVLIDDELAFEWGRKLHRQEGIMAGISSGANLCAAAQVASRPEWKGKRIVTIMCSLGERYLSTPLFADAG
jgi:homoserine kinase type II